MQVAPDVRRQLCRRCVAAALVFLERPGNDGLHVAAVGAMDRAEPCRLFFANHAHGIVQLPADGVGEFAGQQFIQNDAQRVDVAAGIDFCWIPQHLFRAHVSQGPHQLANVGLPGCVRIRVGKPGNSEVKDAGLTGFIDQDVGWFQVTVDKAALMGMLHGIADFRDQLQPLAWIELVGLAIGEQSLAMDQFHGEVGLVTEGRFRGAGVVDLRDPRVLQSAKGLRFVLKSTQHLSSGVAGADDLERDSALWMLLLGLVDGSHAALAKQAKDPVAANGGRQ